MSNEGGGYSETQIRLMIRDEVDQMLLDDTLGLHIRTVVANALRQVGIEDLLQISQGTKKPS